MATNRVYPRGNQLSLVATDPAIPASDDPVLIGQIPAVALTDEWPDGTTTVQTNGVFNLSVKGEFWDPTLNAGAGGKANVAVAAGDIVYYRTADSPKISKDNRGVRFGYALDAVTSGAISTIRVKVGY